MCGVYVGSLNEMSLQEDRVPFLRSQVFIEERDRWLAEYKEKREATLRDGGTHFEMACCEHWFLEEIRNNGAIAQLKTTERGLVTEVQVDSGGPPVPVLRSEKEPSCCCL